MVQKSTVKLPEVRVFAGPNGSGKSTFTTAEWIIPPYINADDIQRERGISNLEAAQIADAMRERAIRERRSFTFETVLSTDSKLELLRAAKNAGFFIKSYFIFTANPELNVTRVAARVANGGHDVPREKIVSRYWRSRERLPKLLALSDICHVYDNTDDKPVRIVRKHKNAFNVFPTDYWSSEAIYRLIGIG